jgi:IclR family KDG regulon transcriptional repressor
MIQSLDRGIKILLMMAERPRIGVTEVAKELQVNKSTAFRLLETLQNNQLVEQDEGSGKYRLGIGVLRISEKLLNSFDIIATARPFLTKLVESTRESAHLCVFSNGKAYVVDQVASTEAMKVTAKIGKSEPLNCSAVGKCLMAFRLEREWPKLLDRMEWTPYTPATITAREQLVEELRKIRTTGYAIDEEELTAGVRCVAAPIYNSRGEVVYCLGISGPATRIRAEKVEEYAHKVKKVADQISAKLGY